MNLKNKVKKTGHLQKKQHRQRNIYTNETDEHSTAKLVLAQLAERPAGTGTRRSTSDGRQLTGT